MSTSRQDEFEPCGHPCMVLTKECPVCKYMAEGAVAERARIIAWLRSDEQNIEGVAPDGNEVYYVMTTPARIADAIERGET